MDTDKGIDKAGRIYGMMNKRVLVLDGSMGVMIQRLSLSEDRFRGERFAAHPVPLKGNNDILCLTCPEAVRSIHRQYLESGADIIETNTFNATSLSQKEYGTAHLVREINLAGARLARAEADRFSTGSRPRFVAGSIGPTGFAASLSSDINDPSARSVSFNDMRDAFAEQAGALIDGGVDMLLIETVFDVLNAKAAVAGARHAMAQRGLEVPLVLSMTVSDSSGRLLSGHTPEAFLSIMEYARPLAVGFNCSAGPGPLSAYVRRLAAVSPFATLFYPNAGLPDSSGAYAETPEKFAATIAPLLRDGVLDIVGGCCGTTPEHISALAKEVERCGDVQRRRPVEGGAAWLAGMEEFPDNRGFINIGERCNVAGSRKFLRLINEKKYDEAVAIARRQVADGAMILDINMDDGLLDAGKEMVRFVRLLAADPDVASVPWMIDSSDFNVVRVALENLTGRAIVNSISLKNGEEEFLRHAAEIHAFGAAVVVMAFDEEGQATTFNRKIEICSRAYRLLTEKVGFNPRDIIFDPNVLTVVTGMPEHDRYALDFIRAVEWIHTNLPGAKTSGGISNLSFAFRGNNYMRQAMHAVFLYHAIKAGLSMAIMDPAAKVTYDSIPQELLELLEDVILCRRPDATERLLAKAALFTADASDGSGTSDESPVITDVDKRLERALLTGESASLEVDIDEALGRHGSAHAVVEGPLMSAMEHVGELFECGKMFLPQVVKSARTMHRAVEILRPHLEAGMSQGNRKGVFLLATVKGDVHDIGKNIAAVVLRCNNFEVIDLGVQVEARAIVDAVREHRPDFIGLSGLISPSLGEMATVARTLREAGFSMPLFVGGAATSELHTALRIAPEYGDGVVVRVSDASQNPVIASRLLADYSGEKERIRNRQRELCAGAATAPEKECPALRPPVFDWSDEVVVPPSFTGGRTLGEVSVSEVRPLINWIYFNNCWKVAHDSAAAADLRRDADELLDSLEKQGAAMRCRIAFYPACPDGDAINVGGVEVPVPRQNPSPVRTEHLALSDFVAPRQYGDYVGCFVVTIGDCLRGMLAESECHTDSYHHILLQSLCDRLAEATSEWLHYQVRTTLWGYSPDEPYDISAICHGKYQGIRPAVGYPCLPDQRLMHTLARLVSPDEVGVSVTSNGALSPASSIAGFYIRSQRARYFSI